jgi:hypothetical protein
VALPAGVSKAVVPPNNERVYLLIQNTGVNPITISFGPANAVAGNGLSLDGATAAGGQGGTISWDTQFGAVPQNPIHAISTAGSTIIVIEG